MIVTPIKDVLLLGHDASVEATRGIITKIQKRFSVGTDNPNTMQRAILTGSDGSEINLVLYAREELPVSYEGREIYLTAQRGGRGQSGLKRRNYEKDAGKLTAKILAQLWCFAGADIAFEESAAGEPQPGQQTTQATQKPVDDFASVPQKPTEPTQTPARQAAPGAPAPGETDEIKNVKRSAMQLGNLYAIACASAALSHKAVGDDVAFPASHIPQVATTIFIQLSRDNHQVKMPTMPLQFKINK